MKRKKNRIKIINSYKLISILIKTLIIIFCLLLYFFYLKEYRNFINENQNNGNYIEIININNYSYKDSFPFENNTNIEAFTNYVKVEIKNKKKSINNIKIIVMKLNSRLGNYLSFLNNAIAFCELFKCENIIVGKNLEVIKNDIYLKNYNFTIKPYIDIDCSKNNVFCVYRWETFYHIAQYGFYPKFDLIRKILKNLPLIKTNPEDLYIYLLRK